MKTRTISLPALLIPVAITLAAAANTRAETGETHEHTNSLIDASSPYLLQHAHNPVNWYPWGTEALERARREDKPIFLSIGYAACHWCHVMERESFENETIARILNENFIAIKVDREERPDIDEIYMAATVAMTGRGGWPMSVFTTPDGKPFECGTYFPPESRGRRRGFRELCLEIARKWKTDRASLISNAGSLTQKVQRRKADPTGTDIVDRQTVARNADRIADSFDPVLGGRRSSGNKFPPTMAMEWMLREFATQRDVSKPYLIETVERTLTQMADGGIYDQLGGGIYRYSTDPRWFAPHFEKMLYDQATCSGVYLSAFQITQNPKYAETARSILDFCLSDMRSPDGGFYSSYNADSEGEEGKFYVWGKSELDALLGPTDAALFNEFYNVTARGNWHRGHNILFVTATDEAFAKRHNMSAEDWSARLSAMRETLLAARAKRVPPSLDDKILAEWNGMLITSLARAGRILDEPRYLDAASRAADFILDRMVVDGRLFRCYRGAKAYNPGFSTDYTNVIEALITLYETTFDRKWLTAAEQLNRVLIEHFHDDAKGGFFYTADDAEKLLVRSKNTRDGVVPSGNSTAALNLLRLAILLDRRDLRNLAEETMRSQSRLAQRGSLERMQWAILFYHGRPREIAIVGDPDEPATKKLIDEVYRHYLPNKVVALLRPSDSSGDDGLPLLKGKKLIDGKPAAYVCENFRCRLPVTSPQKLARELLEHDM